MKTKPASELTLNRFLILLSAANDRAAVKSRSGTTINDDGSAWYAGVYFFTLDALLNHLEKQAENPVPVPDGG